MKQRDYQCHFTAALTPEEATACIADVSAWWAKNCEGATHSLHDAFTVRFGSTFVRFGITEWEPGRKIVWTVTDCYLHWLKDKHEWNGTRVVWELGPAAEGARITMTHEGLVPKKECYEDCNAGWNEHVGDSLRKVMAGHVGMPV